VTGYHQSYRLLELIFSPCRDEQSQDDAAAGQSDSAHMQP